MAAEGADELNKAQKREMKWDRKQAKAKAAAEAAGQTYVPPSKKDKDASVEKMGKRKKRKLASLEQEALTAEQPTTNGTAGSTPSSKSKSAPAEPAVLGMDQPADTETKAEKKKAKKAKKTADSNVSAAPAVEANGADTPPKKKKKKSSKLESTTSEQSTEPGVAPVIKSSKKAKGQPHAALALVANTFA